MIQGMDCSQESGSWRSVRFLLSRWMFPEDQSMRVLDRPCLRKYSHVGSPSIPPKSECSGGSAESDYSKPWFCQETHLGHFREAVLLTGKRVLLGRDPTQLRAMQLLLEMTHLTNTPPVNLPAVKPFAHGCKAWRAPGLVLGEADHGDRLLQCSNLCYLLTCRKGWNPYFILPLLHFFTLAPLPTLHPHRHKGHPTRTPFPTLIHMHFHFLLRQILTGAEGKSFAALNIAWAPPAFIFLNTEAATRAMYTESLSYPSPMPSRRSFSITWLP